MEWQEHVRLPFYADRGYVVQHIKNSAIRKVALARGGKAAVEGHLEPCHRLAAYPRNKHFGGTHRTHRMAARRSVTYSVDLSYRFHICCFSTVNKGYKKRIRQAGGRLRLSWQHV